MIAPLQTQKQYLPVREKMLQIGEMKLGQKLNSMERGSGKSYRSLTETQWIIAVSS